MNNLKKFEKVLNFQKIINKIATKGDGGFHKKMPHKYSPTELSGCIRNSYFSRLHPEKFDEQSHRNFLQGNILHELVQNNVKDIIGKELDYIENEKAFHYLLPFEKTKGKRILISGRLDTIFYLKGEDKPIVVDYKTTQNVYYNAKDAKKEHKEQLNYYMANTLADYGMIIYIDKRNLNVIQHTIPFSQERFDNMINYAINLDDAIETQSIPVINKLEQEDMGNCKYCRHKTRCKEAKKDKPQKTGG